MRLDNAEVFRVGYNASDIGNVQPHFAVKNYRGHPPRNITPVATEPRSPRVRRLLVPLLLVAISALALTLRLLHLGAKSFWFDEIASVSISQGSWGTFLTRLWSYEGNMAFYYCVLRLWLHGTGSEFGIRLLSVIAAVATIPAIYLLTKGLVDTRAALLAALFLSVHASHIEY